MKKRYLLLAGAVAVLAACSDDILDNSQIEILPETPVDGVVTMQMTAGSQDRIETPQTTRGTRKGAGLEWVATITNPKVQGNDSKRVWSATAVAIDDSNQKVYITWHSDRQAEHKAQVWGGAVDVVNISGEHEREIKISQTGTNNLLKFNNVLIYNGNLYLSATSARVGGTVARVSLGDFDGKDKVPVACVGFPGNSVNAVSCMADGQMIAVSGHDAGAYASFDPNIDANENYEPGTGITILNPGTDLVDNIVPNFGGKYVVTEAGATYVLYNKTDDNAKIRKIDGNEFDLGVKLVSSDKYAEIYSESGGWQDVEVGTAANYYGKHVLAVKDGYAYVGAGKNGLRVYDLKTQKKTWDNSTNTIGVFADDNYVYAATGAGLRVYKPDGKGGLDLYAYEVESYYGENEEETKTDSLGLANSSQTPVVGEDAKRHSPNFVVAHRNPIDKKIYVYIAYGQSGVRVYRLVEEAEKDPEANPDYYYPYTIDIGDDVDVVWATEDFPGYYAWGEVFYPDSIAHADAGTKGLWGDIDHGDNYTLSLHDTTWVNDATYYGTCQEKYRNGKATYTWANYRFFDYGQYERGVCYKGDKGDNDHKWKVNFDKQPDKSVSSEHHFLWGYVCPSFDSPQRPVVKYGLDRKELFDADDVVKVKWGNGWRMPTQKEWKTLVETARKFAADSVLYKISVVDGVEGYRWRVTEKGDFIFFPCTGHYEGKEFERGPGGKNYASYKECNYWTSTLVHNDEAYAYAVEIDISAKNETVPYYRDPIETNTEKRWKGFKIRPVREKTYLISK